MAPSAWTYGLDERGAGGGVDDQVAQHPCVSQHSAAGWSGLFKLETDVVCIR